MKNMLLAFLMLVAVKSAAQQYTAADAASDVKFSIKNFGLTVTGSFKGLQGKIIFNPSNIAASSFAVSVAAATVSTGNGSRDNHLKKKDYFDAANYPVLNFVSARIAAKGDSYLMEGMLTIKGITKLVSFPFTATVQQNGYLFTGQFAINRRDFGVGGSSWVLADELTVQLRIFAR